MWCRGGVGGIGYERCPGGCATSSPRGDEEEEADVDVSRQEPNGGRGGRMDLKLYLMRVVLAIA